DFLYGTLHRALGEVRPDSPLAMPAAIAQPLVSGSQAGEFGPQGEMSLAANLLESQPVENRWRAPGSGYQGSYPSSGHQGPGGTPQAEVQGVYREYFSPLA